MKGSLKKGKDCLFYKHGMTHTPTHNSWIRMNNRCNNPGDPKYLYYGARGIKICERWKNFINFFKDMGPRPRGMGLDRIDNASGYFPENCKWSTMKEQCRNRRSTRIYEHEGKKMCLTDWCDSLNLRFTTISDRMKRGYSFETSISIKKGRHLISKPVRQLPGDSKGMNR